MDPVTQGAIGAVAAQSATGASARKLALTGMIAGLAPDLDVLIASASDPLLTLTYHRQFTHALLFIPIGALGITLLMRALPGPSLPFRSLYLAALVGYATHGLLDACTSYGTQLLWPLSDARIAWNLVSVIDPALTLPLLGLGALAWATRHRGWAVLALIWVLIYLTLGAVQAQRVDAQANVLASARGHERSQALIKPAFGSILLWKSVYRHEDRYYVDGLRATASVQHCGGANIAALAPSRDLPWLQKDSLQYDDLTRFAWFSDGYLALWATPDRNAGQPLIIDVRYANLPTEVDPLWGIELDQGADARSHVRWWTNRRASAAQRKALTDLLKGRGCGATVQSSRP